MHIAVCTPARDQVHTSYAFDLANLVKYETSNGHSITPVFMEGTLIFDQRQKLAQAALDMGADYILWIDSDMRFPHDALERMVGHNLPIVAANYSTRRLPAFPTAYLDPDGQHPIYTKRGDTHLELAAFAGMGFMLTHIDVFNRIPKPWFFIPYSPEYSGGYDGEDVFFCRRAAEHHIPTMVDHLVSQRVRHVGSFEYSIDHANIPVPQKQAAK